MQSAIQWNMSHNVVVFRNTLEILTWHAPPLLDVGLIVNAVSMKLVLTDSVDHLVNVELMHIVMLLIIVLFVNVHQGIKVMRESLVILRQIHVIQILVGKVRYANSIEEIQSASVRKV